MNMIKKISKILIIFAIIFNIIGGYSFADTTNTTKSDGKFSSWNDLISSGKSFISNGEKEGSQIFTDDSIENLTVPIANVLTAIGTIVVVVSIIILGIRYTMATPEQAAKIKQQLIGVIVAAIVIFGAVIIWRITYQVLNDINTNI